MMPDMSYNPQFGGYNQSFFNPYGFGGGMPPVSQMQFGGGYPGMGFGGMPIATNTMGMGGYDPGGFMNNFQSQLQDMFDKYFSGQQSVNSQMEPGMTEVPGVTPTTTGSPSTGASTAGSTTGATTPELNAPDFGNLGARFDKGKTLTRKAEKKLNRMGYTDDQLHTARQAGGGSEGFRNALGGMQPTYKSKTDAGTYRR